MVIRAVLMAPTSAGMTLARNEIWNALADAAGVNYNSVADEITGVRASDGTAQPTKQKTSGRWPPAIQVPGGQWYTEHAPVATVNAALRPLNTTTNAFRTDTPIYTPGGRTFGAMYDLYDADGSHDDWMQLYMQHIGAVVPGHGGAWSTVEPSPGVWDWQYIDRIYNFARRFRLRMFSPQLFVYSGLKLYDSNTDSWQVTGLNSSNWQFYVDRLIQRYMQRYPDIDDWIICNESIAEPPPGHRPWSLQAAAALPGEPYRYLAYAFQRAKVYRPTARLIINDYGCEQNVSGWSQLRRDEMLIILDYLIAQGAAPTHVGFQSHLDPDHGYSAAVLQTFGGQLASRGLKAVVTELDIKTHRFGTDEAVFSGTVAEQNQAASDYVQTWLTEFLADFDCDTVVTWGITDARTWLTGLDAPSSRPLPFDTSLNIKPMGTMLRSVLSSAP